MERKRFFFAKRYVHITNSKQRKHRDGHPLEIRLDVEFRRRAADVVLKPRNKMTTI